MQQEDMYVVEASIRDHRGLLKVYPASFLTLDQALDEYNKLLNNDDGWYWVKIVQGDKIIKQVFPNNKGENNG